MVAGDDDSNGCGSVAANVAGNLVGDGVDFAEQWW